MMTAHENLKAATAEAHLSIEKKMGPYFNQPSPESYKEMIQNYAGFYEILETRFQEYMAHFPDTLQLSQRLQKSTWLQKDLKSLSHETARAQKVMSQRWPDLKSKAGFLGALYVIEGSTLGGQFLLKRFKETLGISDDNGGKFFAGYGPETGIMWRRFLSVLNEELQTPEEIQDAVQSAQNTFRLMEECMS